jgi:predicted esterase
MDQFQHPVRIILLKGPVSSGTGSAWPWSAADFEIYGNAVSEAIALLAIKFPTAGKPILMGFSGGGMMAYYQAAKHGNQYSYVFPISGQLTSDQLGKLNAHPSAKVHAYHGRNDAVLSISGGRAAVEILRKNGVEVEFTEFEGGHLGVFTDMKPVITRAIEKELAALS